VTKLYYETELGKLYHGDCLKIMKDISDKSIDMILCDMPYGTTSCKWDIVIDLDKMWDHYKRIIKNNGAIVLFGQEPFSSLLRCSNLKMYKYDWIWDKHIPFGMGFAKYRPMQQTELISVFCKEKTKYNPQMIKRDKPIKQTTGTTTTDVGGFPKFDFQKNKIYKYKNPITLIAIPKIPNSKGTLIPTQKPVKLFEYLIKTYTNKNDLVLDNCAGSGTTGIACLNLKRKFILIEKEEEYYRIAQCRIHEVAKINKLF